MKLAPEQWRANIPREMRELPRWIGHRAKKPIRLTKPVPAAVDNPAAWGTFEEAATFYAETLDDPEAGVGFVFTEGDGLTFIDLDRVGVPGHFTPDGQRLLQDLSLGGITRETYAEVSPSGQGIHIFGRGLLAPGTRHVLRLGDAAVEVYARGRYSTVTGQRLGLDRLGDIQRYVDTLTVRIGTGTAANMEAPEPERIAEVTGALSYLDPDMPYEDWLRVGMALRAGLGKAGRQLWLAWSASGRKHVLGEPEEKWSSFRRTGVGLGTLFFMAQRAGWEGLGDDRPDPATEFPVEAAGEGGLRIVPLSTVKREELAWLWEGRLPLGHVSLIAGDPGRGKSILTVDLAASITRGRPLPGQKVVHQGRVFLLNAEDGQGDVIRPRFEAVGGDLDLMHVLDLTHGGRAPQLPDDVEILDRLLAMYGDVRLLVLDPLNACIPVRLDAHKDQHVRQALAPLAALAQKHRCAIALVVHLNKTRDAGSALYRVSGSVGIGAAARSVLFVGTDPDDENRRVVAQAKPQLGPPPASLAFFIRGAPSNEKVGVVEWLGLSEVEATALVERAPTGVSKAEQAEAWLAERLAVLGPVRSKVILDQGQAVGYSAKILRAAFRRLGGIYRRLSGFQSEVEWLLPSDFTQGGDAQ